MATTCQPHVLCLGCNRCAVEGTNPSTYEVSSGDVKLILVKCEALIVAGLLETLGSLLTGFAPTLSLLILGRHLANGNGQYDGYLCRKSELPKRLSQNF